MPAPDRLRLRPAPGRLVFIPETGRPLAAEGEVVILSSFWRRRLTAGDVVRVPPPVAEWTDLPPPADETFTSMSPPIDEDLPAEPDSDREDA